MSRKFLASIGYPCKNLLGNEGLKGWVEVLGATRERRHWRVRRKLAVTYFMLSPFAVLNDEEIATVPNPVLSHLIIIIIIIIDFTEFP